MRTSSQTQQQASFAAKAKDLQALRDAVVEAATVSGPLWISYLFVFFYLAIAAGGVTHRDLFFENPVKLPFLNVDLPLIGFFVLGPLLFLIVHAYTLLNFAMLAGKVSAFHTELEAQIRDDGTRARLRLQLPNNIFVQFLAGPRGLRTGRIGFMLRLISYISLVIGPIALLVLFQLQFLPYHHAAITWWQRLTVIADLFLVWALWPAISRGTTQWLGFRDFRRTKVLACALASLLPIFLMFTVATFPGEWLNDRLPSIRFIPTPWQRIAWSSPHELLVAGQIDDVARRPSSPWSNKLILPGIDIIDHLKLDSESKIAHLPTVLSLRGRHLQGAVLTGARLLKTHFTGAQLKDGVLSNADLREAIFDCGWTGSERKCADLRGVQFGSTQLRGASMMDAQLQGANFYRAELQGAALGGAKLLGASMYGTRLQGAFLMYATLQGSVLEGANLEGAILSSALLSATHLAGTNFRGADLNGVDFQGASLEPVFGHREKTRFEGALIDNARVWRMNPQGAKLDGARISSLDTRAQESDCRYLYSYGPCRWTVDAFMKLKQDTLSIYGFGLRNVENLDPNKSFDTPTVIWWELEASSPSAEHYQNTLAATLRAVGCSSEAPPYVIRGLLDFFVLRLPNLGSHVQTLAGEFLNEEQCPGARGLTDRERSYLRRMRDFGEPPPLRHSNWFGP